MLEFKKFTDFPRGTMYDILHGYNNMPQDGLNGLIGMYLFEKVVIVK